MTKKAELTSSMLSMKLNAVNRKSLINVIMRDALKGRSDKVRAEMTKLMTDMRERSFGKTPQARSANRKKMKEFATLSEHLRSKGIEVRHSRVGDRDKDLYLNLAGKQIRIYFKTFYSQSHTVNFWDEFTTPNNYYRADVMSSGVAYDLGSSSLTLTEGDTLNTQFWKLAEEAKEIATASEELQLTLTPMLKASTLGKAVANWPELKEYAPLIMSQSREVIVRPEVLTARIKALKIGKCTAAEAMKVTKGK